jgi:PPOX class probable F420-dependent enzyme
VRVAEPLTDEQIRAFLGHGTRTGKLATTRADGGPHVAPVWFILDGPDLLFMTGAKTVKGRNLQRDPRAALVVDLEEPPYGFVMVSGTVELTDDTDDTVPTLPISIQIARRYMGEELAEQFGRRNAVPGELLVRLRPDKVVAFGDVSD